MKLIELSGQRFGRWSVLHRCAPTANAPRDPMWLCRCECGTLRPVSGKNLRHGTSHSCGCLTSEVTIARCTKHGCKPRSGCTREYDAWCNAKARCYDTGHPRYPDWGGRGIVMCDRWRHDFSAFLSDMGPKPSGRQLDRINNDGPYSPENCRWATLMEQRHNQRKRGGWYGRTIAFNGEAHSIAEWARRTGLSFVTLNYRIKKGWDIERALTAKPKH